MIEPIDEGVIKFKIEYRPAAELSVKEFREIDDWRDVLYALGLIGEIVLDNQIVGYGNISKRTQPIHTSPPRFVITATQTGGYPQLSPKQYVTVLACLPEENKVIAQGPALPSSESMTHGILYVLDPNIDWVMHAHSAPIWRNAYALELPITHPTVPYGTPEMTNEVIRVFEETDVREAGVFSMGGHEDGVVAFGKTPEETAGMMILYLGLALEMEENSQR